MALLDEPLSRTRRVSEARIAGNVRVSRSWMANSSVVVWAVSLDSSLRAGELGKREAVWPSGPMPRIEIVGRNGFERERSFFS